MFAGRKTAMLLSQSTRHKQDTKHFPNGMRNTMQRIETGKQSINELLTKYGPVGPRHLLAAALMMHRPRDEEKAAAAPKKDVRAA